MGLKTKIRKRIRMMDDITKLKLAVAKLIRENQRLKDQISELNLRVIRAESHHVVYGPGDDDYGRNKRPRADRDDVVVKMVADAKREREAKAHVDALNERLSSEILTPTKGESPMTLGDQK